MVVNHFSVSTIKGYMAAIKRLHAFYNLPPEQLTEHQLVAFVCHIKEGLNLSPESMRVAVSAIKYFYRHILGMAALSQKVPYPKKEKYIRTILSGAETKTLFEKTTNLKHRLLLKLTYSAGLRRSEAITVQLADFDWKNMQLLVRQGKGRKDRYSVLAHSLKPDFDQYVGQFSPQQFLFYGRDKKRPMSENSTHWIMDQAIERARIKKEGICLHSLRHSFASHLLAIHTDVVTVQKLMGHEHLSTTMQYFHLGNRPNAAPLSPMDTIYPKP
jgi:site-specific recombinase XerD